MTPKEVKFQRGATFPSAPVSEEWMYAVFRTPKGRLVCANYWVGDHSPLGNLAPFSIDPLTDDGHSVDSKNPLWAGDSMLGLMCAIEALGLTPEVTRRAKK